MTSGRLGLLVTSPRVAPGLLSYPAWAAVAGADRVLARAADEPLVEALADAGLAAECVGDLPPAALARRLVEAARELSVLWLGSGDGDPGLSDAVAAEVSRLQAPPEVELVVGSWDVQGGRLLDVVAAMDRLRSPGGCPWDAQQTHASLAPYLIEEAYEVLDAVDDGDPRALAEELGDVLLQVVFHARLAEDAPEGAFDVDTVAGLLVDKLVRRHPHVFADGDAATPEEVEQEWERIKTAERSGSGHSGSGHSGSGGYSENLLHGVPASLPPALAAAKVRARLRRRGLTADPEALAALEEALAALEDLEAGVRSALAALAASARPGG